MNVEVLLLLLMLGRRRLRLGAFQARLQTNRGKLQV